MRQKYKKIDSLNKNFEKCYTIYYINFYYKRYNSYKSKLLKPTLY
jgi:hypothetical protein